MQYAANYSPSINAISGWVSKKDDNQSEDDVIVILKGLKGEIGRTKLDVQRDDVKNAGLHDTGMCGFRFYELTHQLVEGNFYTIYIITNEDTIRLSILYGNAKDLLKSFIRFELLPRSDFSVMKDAPVNLFSTGSDLINFKKLMIRLRRGKRAKNSRGTFEGVDYSHKEDDWMLFKSIVIANQQILFNCFDSRYLWSVIDTFVDYGDTSEKLAGLAISNWMFQERFAQTLNCVYDFSEKSNPVLNTQITYWGGMKSNRLLEDDAFDVFVTKNIECLELTPLIKCFFIELLFRSISEKHSTIEINFKYSDHLKKVGDFYKDFLKKYTLDSNLIQQAEKYIEDLFSVSEKKKYLVGPSHIVRLKHALETKQLPNINHNSIEMIGAGAMPIWSPRISKLIGLRNAEEIFYLIGDFRFGNSIFKRQDFKTNILPSIEGEIIEKNLINESNDKKMFELCLFSLNQFLKRPGKHRILFWDLSFREYENRRNKKYFVDGVYKHPVWNLSDVLAQYSAYAIDSRDIIKYGDRLFIDSSAHPSFLGWMCLYQYIEAKKIISVSSIIDVFDKELPFLLSKLTQNKSVIITGESVFTKTLERFIQEGKFFLPKTWHIASISEAIKGLKTYNCCLFFPSVAAYKLSPEEFKSSIKGILDTQKKLKYKYKNTQILFYDNWAYESVSKRKDFFGKFISEYDNQNTQSMEALVCKNTQSFKMTHIENFEAVLELNITLIPTLLGLLEIFGRAVGSFEANTVFDQYTDLYNKIIQS